MNAMEIVDYDPSWPPIFETMKADIERLIGDLAEDIHHIGSTSVPGLAAKPKIDIDAVLRSTGFLPEAIDRVKQAGHAFHGDPYGDGLWTFTRGSPGARLYLCGPDNATHIERVLFRDWLRVHPEAAAEYAALKRLLAAQADGDWELYTRGKSDFVARIVGLAAQQEESGVVAQQESKAGLATSIQQ